MKAVIISNMAAAGRVPSPRTSSIGQINSKLVPISAANDGETPGTGCSYSNRNKVLLQSPLPTHKKSLGIFNMADFQKTSAIHNLMPRLTAGAQKLVILSLNSNIFNIMENLAIYLSKFFILQLVLAGI